MQRCAFVTGASGFLGSYVVQGLLDVGFGRVVVLARGASKEACAEHLRSLWWERPGLRDELGQRIEVVRGDVCDELLGLDPGEYRALAAATTHIVHAAALIGINETADAYAAVNVGGTLNVLLFAEAARDAGALERLVHVSTEYVAGTRRGIMREDELVDTEFNSFYEQSKFGAEQLVRDAMPRIPASIVRPAQIVGDSEAGFASTFNTLYYPLKLYLKGRLPVIPAASGTCLNMVPVDFVARVVLRALTDAGAQGKTFHAGVPLSHQPSVGQMVEQVRSWARDTLGFDPGKPRYAPVPHAAGIGRRRNLAASSTPKRKSPVQNMLALAPYLSEQRIYDVANTRELMGGEWPDWRDYLPRLLAHATRKGFLNHTGRTVFEQMLVRLSSKRSHFTLYDVDAGGISRLEGAEFREAILRAAGALQARGIGAGSRVALAGVNSTRYLIADAAIGLLGATSVPLYFTSPAADIAAVVRQTRASLVFVGTTALAESLPELLDVPLVSLLAESPSSALTPWAEFLDEASPLAEMPAVPFDSVATIRSTSGTTGEPKGAMFTQYQLRWMAETMPSLLDWRTRNAPLSYLSFLPMSHVVEGILVAYAPYFILSDIDYYCLNDFGALVQTLPKVRPALFFSVPRFYEKLWAQFAATDAGRRWIAMPEGPAKRAAAVPLRRALLRRAGLDRCRQLLVGSAPIGTDLLESFRSLGIEIHNAFGVTEAPLITLSRYGNNEIGSVGDLLPCTEARIDRDGLVHVRGPQVTAGYDGVAQPVVDEEGWLCTGDLGEWSPTGRLVLTGRAKEVAVTSYGKNIALQKIEVLLKGIDGVGEAMAVADVRPFVTALLWLDDEAGEDFDFAALDTAVRAVNGQLSHPEQVKRWIVAAHPLAISSGELTPNLKLRRKAIAAGRGGLVEALYAGWDGGLPADALHRGEA